MLSRILTDLKYSYGINCHETTPITGGWLNQKWKASTDHGELLIKQFSSKRFGPNNLRFIEAALQRQILVEKEGVLCPKIRQNKGRAIRLLDDSTAYMVMDFCGGKTAGPGQLTDGQMNSLGSACGFMHRAFSRLPVHSVLGYPIGSEDFLSSLWENYNKRIRDLSADAPEAYRKALSLQEPVLKQFSATYLGRLPKGIAHEDFTSDNLLFTADTLSAIIDFDRNQYSFLWHDIGRAVLSFALHEHRLDNRKIHAFLEGYLQYSSLTLPDIADALRISWCIETPWWIQPSFFSRERGKAIRFRDEILWLTEHFFEIDDLLGCKSVFHCNKRTY